MCEPDFGRNCADAPVSVDNARAPADYYATAPALVPCGHSSCSAAILRPRQRDARVESKPGSAAAHPRLDGSATLNVLGPLHGNQDRTQWERPATGTGRVLAASGEGDWLWAS